MDDADAEHQIEGVIGVAGGVGVASLEVGVGQTSRLGRLPRGVDRNVGDVDAVDGFGDRRDPQSGLTQRAAIVEHGCISRVREEQPLILSVAVADGVVVFVLGDAGFLGEPRIVELTFPLDDSRAKIIHEASSKNADTPAQIQQEARRENRSPNGGGVYRPLFAS
uniref:Uncharacterized protein n=1 Tax=Phenylobacterium glaciei TaxID=2803784 RepID=A0A974SAV9_9CAUL|nr:hypothetical protein JKL49_11655 [Phenylobacterium glaciei]